MGKDKVRLSFYRITSNFGDFRKAAEVQMEGQFLVRQIYEDEITYNVITAAVDILSMTPEYLLFL